MLSYIKPGGQLIPSPSPPALYSAVPASFSVATEAFYDWINSPELKRFKPKTIINLD
jgi:hypothetical protein